MSVSANHPTAWLWTKNLLIARDKVALVAVEVVSQTSVASIASSNVELLERRLHQAESQGSYERGYIAWIVLRACAPGDQKANERESSSARLPEFVYFESVSMQPKVQLPCLVNQAKAGQRQTQGLPAYRAKNDCIGQTWQSSR